jgi:acetyl-CoA synthetase
LKKEIADLLRETIGPVAVPGEIYFVDSIPKTRSGKIMRRVLKAVASGHDVGDLTTLENEASVEEIRNALESLRHTAATPPADYPR